MGDVKLYCGTSGFAYSSWKPDFYGQNLPSAERLSYYATRLNAVEVDYNTWLAPRPKLEQWIAATPSGFLILPKMRLSFESAGEWAESFWENLHPLRRAQRLGPVLFQIASHSKGDRPHLFRFLKLLPKGISVAFEFRNGSWFDEDTYRVLRDANAALCFMESTELETPWVLTSDFVYLRLRKPEYLEAKLISIQYRVEQYLANAYPTFAIFKGGKSATGALSAEKLLMSQKMTGTAT